MQFCHDVKKGILCNVPNKVSIATGRDSSRPMYAQLLKNVSAVEAQLRETVLQIRGCGGDEFWSERRWLMLMDVRASDD